MRIIIVLLFFFAVVCIPAFPAYSQTIVGSGCSVSNLGYLTELATEYERRTGTKVFVRGGGSLAGIEDLNGGKVDLAASCRGKLKNDPKDIEFIHVAWDALVFIVHRTNPLNGISNADVRAIYKGKLRNWEQLHGRNETIKVFLSKSQKGLSGVESSLIDSVLEGAQPVIGGNVYPLASSGIVEAMVEQTPQGFAVTGYSSARKRNVKILALDSVDANRENIIAGKYPLKRPLFILTPKNKKQEVKKFIDYVLSDEGQKYISSVGAISLLDIKP